MRLSELTTPTKRVSLVASILMVIAAASAMFPGLIFRPLPLPRPFWPYFDQMALGLFWLVMAILIFPARNKALYAAAIILSAVAFGFGVVHYYEVNPPM
jgi:hypothetical protein